MNMIACPEWLGQVQDLVGTMFLVVRRITIAIGASLVLGSAASAESVTTPRSPLTLPQAFSARTDQDSRAGQVGSQILRKGLRFDAQTGRWGLQFDMSQPVRGGTDWKDVQAGAYYRFTPSFRVGGAVGLGADPENLAAKARTASPNVPRIKLETAFKF